MAVYHTQTQPHMLNNLKCLEPVHEFLVLITYVEASSIGSDDSGHTHNLNRAFAARTTKGLRQTILA